jgi:hypothetical protein
MAKRLGKIIISEAYLNDQLTIPATQIGGQAGGTFNHVNHYCIHCSIGSNPDLKYQASSDTFYFLMHRQEIYVQRVRRIMPLA